MKRFFGFIFIFVFLIFSLNVKAKEINWQEICENYENFLNNDNYKFTYDDNNLTVSLKNDSFGDYSIEFNYADGKVTYNNNRDVSSSSDDLKYWYDMCDSYFVFGFAESIFAYFQVDPQIDTSSAESTEYGVDLVDDEVSYNLSDGTNVSGTSIKSLVFDLNKFNEATLDYQNTENSFEYYLQLYDFLSSFIDPMNDKLPSADDFSSYFDDIIDQAQDESENEVANKNSGEVSNKRDVSLDKQVVEVPSTGSNSIYIMIGIIICAISLGIITYFIILKNS